VVSLGNVRAVVVVGILGLLHDSWPKRTQAFWINVPRDAGPAAWLTLIARSGGAGGIAAVAAAGSR